MNQLIECKLCDSPYCNGCNIYELAVALHKGYFDEFKDEVKHLVIDSKIHKGENKMLEKVYAVDFMAYTNCLNDTVSDWDGVSSFTGKEKYLTVKGPKVFLVKESDLEKYSKYGQGYKNLTCIGWMEV